ncbi:hypothetical protein [Stenotrophomonas maltophilia]|uniref:hypothetical protein n=1 Tax=Stenotrophomonas maltophilia TaxID=40324 RepID=UPI003D18A2B1
MRAKIIDAMKQADMVLKLTTKRRRKREFLAEMERVVPWAALVVLIAPPHRLHTLQVEDLSKISKKEKKSV